MAVAVVRALWRREITKFLRDRSRLIGALVQPLGFWVLLGLGFYGSFQLPGAAEVGYLEYLYPGIIALILLFTAIFSTISVVQERQEGFLQAALVAPVSRTAIVLGLVSGGTTLAVAEAALFLLLAPLVGLTPTLVGLGVVVLAAVLMALAFTALGFTIAWRLDTTRGFHAVMNLFLLPMWFLSGAFFPAAGVPAALRWVMWANPAYYGVAAVREGLYWPAEAPGLVMPLGLALGVAALFAVAMVGLAVHTVRRPLFG
ncbi:MAG: ABC transporter permease [Rhodothermales bacterium]|nr:ABC transporter permease [Rhodothermales bacterium]